MPKVIVMVDDVVIREVLLTQERTTLGRRPYNDIVIDSLAVSGEHAVLQMEGDDIYLEDLHSTNGTYVNGKAINNCLLQNGDTIEMGKCKIRFVNEATDGNAVDALHALIRVMSGAAAGRELALTKAVTTIGKPGLAVAAVSQRGHGFYVHHVEGAAQPTLNGLAIGVEPAALKDGDVIELAGIKMQFVQN